MKKEFLGPVVENETTLPLALAPMQPTDLVAHGKAVWEETLLISQEGMELKDEELVDLIEASFDEYGEPLMAFVGIKFGIVTSTLAPSDMHTMDVQAVALRIINRHQANPEEFKAALKQVLIEEREIWRATHTGDLMDYEKNTLKALDEVAYLSGNHDLQEFIVFTHDLDVIFQGKAYLFSYLEHRYAEFFGVPNLSPEFLAAQMALDFLRYRENYQLGIISDYERLMNALGPDPMVAGTSNSLQ